MNALLILTFALVCVASPPRTSDKWTYQDEGETQDRIIKGTDAERHQFPYIVYTYMDRDHWCGASVISPSWVVSAAHCYYRNEHSKWTAFGGVLILGENHPDVQITPVAKIVMHPEYNFHSNDIALLNLASSFVFTEAVKPVTLPKPNEDHSGRVWLSGWGATNMNPEEYPAPLKFLQMIIASNKECNDIFAKVQDLVIVGGTTFCTLPLKQGQSACHGDSGGPLVQDGVLVGIVHGGDNNCGIFLNENLPNVFTKVSLFVDFIKNHVTDLPA